ncbi:hypothetical protein SMD22_07510 [Brevibacillus halotolerans]|nr:hypothetical protein SMD22_07510 [Brevibacillus halotolerans]
MVEKMEFVTISVQEYRQLQDDSYKLSCLEACGVDNWCGYSEAMQMFDEEE